MKTLRHDRCDLGDAGPIQIHHIHPFEDCVDAGRPELELCLENLAALCETEPGKPTQDHHLVAGHLGDFKSCNLTLERDMPVWKGLKGAAIEARSDWKALAASRPVEYHAMTPANQAAFRDTLAKDLPPSKITTWDGTSWKRNGKVLTPEQAAVPDPFFAKQG